MPKKPKAKQAEPTSSQVDERKMQPHELLLSPVCQSVITMAAWGKFAGEADLQETVTGLHKKVEQIQKGDMGSVEAMLYGQAVALETIFTNLARRSASNAGEFIKAADTYMRLALKAQAQCRSTLEALIELKNPRPIAFVKQANISNGPQQVNNGINPEYVHAHTEKTQNLQNELLEANSESHGLGENMTTSSLLPERQNA